jgi:arylsulfatase A-like enzyme
MVSSIDFWPTLLAAAGGAPSAGQAPEGINLLPYLTGERSGAPHEYLYWRTGNNGAIRHGMMKLLILGDRLRLYDLGHDVEESHDLSKEKPEVVQRMHEAWKAWNAQLQPPRHSERTVVTHYNGDEVRWDI